MDAEAIGYESAGHGGGVGGGYGGVMLLHNGEA